MSEPLHGKDLIALRRLSDASNKTIANVGETCEKVPASKGGTVDDALRFLLASGKIAPARPVMTVAAPDVTSVDKPDVSVDSPVAEHVTPVQE